MSVYLEFNGFGSSNLCLLWAASCDECFFAFLAARHRAILFSMFVLLIFIARWQINMMMMLSIRLRNDLYCVGWGVEPYLLTMAAEYRIRSANSDK